MNVKRENPARVDPDFLEQEGWELFLRLQEPDADATDLEQFERWKEGSASHAEIGLQIEQLWIDMDAVQGLPWPTSAEVERDKPGFFAAQPLRRWTQIGAALAASVAIFFFLNNFFADKPLQFSTGRGEHRLVNLPDGSELILGAMSEVAVEYSSAQRRIRQRKGEVLFTVAEDAKRPFVVGTQSATVLAVGTAFNVNASTDATIVSVLKGIVRVDPGEDPGGAWANDPVGSRRLVASEQLAVRKGLILQDVHSTNMDDVLAWRSGRFVFSGSPLSFVVDEINRYSAAEIKLGDTEAGDLLYTGTVQRNLLDSWLPALEASFPVKVSREGASFVIHSAPAETDAAGQSLPGARLLEPQFQREVDFPR